MLLLNFVRVLIALVGLLVVDAFRRAYELESLALYMFGAFVLMLVLIISDVAEDRLIAYFNPEDSKS